MELFNIVNIYSDKFIPVFIRVAVMLSFIPFLGAQTTPAMARAGLALALTLLLMPVVNVQTANPVKAIFEAFFVGTALGLCARIILAAVETAGQWMSIEIGFGMAAIFNPMFSEQLGPLSFFYTFVSMGIFFVLGIHYYFIEGIARSFELSSVDYTGIFGSIMKLNTLLFPLAFKIAAPVMLVQMIVNITLGFFAKVLPQANIFMVSIPLMIFLGLFFVTASMPLAIIVISKSFVHIKDAILMFTGAR